MDANCLSSSVKVLTCCTAAACVSAYIYHKAPFTNNVEEYAGLVNNGNTCYMNAILQSLASCPEFLKELAKASSSEDVFAASLLGILQKLSKPSSTRTHNPAFIMRELEVRGWKIAESDEHDAHEFFHACMTTIEDEIKALIQKKHRYVEGLNNSVSSIDDHMALSLPLNDKSDPFSLFISHKFNFGGRIGQKLVCSKCEHKSPIRYEEFTSLSLPIHSLVSKGAAVVTLNECIKSYMQPESLDQVDCESCTRMKQKQHEIGDSNPGAVAPTANQGSKKKWYHPNLNKLKIFEMTLAEKQEVKLAKPKLTIQNVKTSFTKYIFISKYPQTLCIHLQRLTWHRGYPMKIHNHVQFPERLYNTDFEQEQWFGARETACLKKSPFFDSLTSDISDYLPDKHASTSMPYLGRKQSSIERFWTSVFHKEYIATSNTDVAKQQKRYEELAKLKETCKNVPLYQLCAVIVHLGGGFNSSGHFITYRRVNGSMWLQISDSKVLPCTINHVLATSAYLLFYERITSS